jgi:hypothetical protein
MILLEPVSPGPARFRSKSRKLAHAVLTETTLVQYDVAGDEAEQSVSAARLGGAFLATEEVPTVTLEVQKHRHLAVWLHARR